MNILSGVADTIGQVTKDALAKREMDQLHARNIMPLASLAALRRYALATSDNPAYRAMADNFASELKNYGEQTGQDFLSPSTASIQRRLEQESKPISTGGPLQEQEL